MIQARDRYLGDVYPVSIKMFENNATHIMCDLSKDWFPLSLRNTLVERGLSQCTGIFQHSNYVLTEVEDMIRCGVCTPDNFKEFLL